MVELEGSLVTDAGLLRRARRFGLDEGRKAVQMFEPFLVRSLLGEQRGSVRDYLVIGRDGAASVMARRAFEDRYIVEREPRARGRKAVIR